MWMICDTSRLNEKPSFDRTRIDDSRSSYWCASVRCAQFRTMFVVGTSSTFITRVLIGCLPGSSGSTHTPLRPRSTRSPCVNASPDTSRCSRADVADDDADVADRDLGQRHLLDLHEPRVQVPRAGQQHLLLQAAAAAGVDERLAALEAVVPGDDRARQIARGNRPAVEHRHDADAIGRHLIDVQVLRRHAVLLARRRGVTTSNSAGLMRYVPAVRNAICRPRSPPSRRNASASWKLSHATVAREHALGRNRRAVGRDDERDLAGLHDDRRAPCSTL